MSFCTLRLESHFNFGKYKTTNKRVSEVLDTDPQYVKWCIENTNCHPSQEVIDVLKEKGLEPTRMRSRAKFRIKHGKV